MMHVDFLRCLLWLLSPELFIQRGHWSCVAILPHLHPIHWLMQHDLLPKILHLFITRLQQLPQLNNPCLQICIVMQDVPHKMANSTRRPSVIAAFPQGRNTSGAL